MDRSELHMGVQYVVGAGHFLLPEGSLVELYYDDGTPRPSFTINSIMGFKDGDGTPRKRVPICLTRLQPKEVTVITCLQELLDHGELEHGDRLLFGDYVHTVNSTSIHCSGYANDKVFKGLCGVSDRAEFCSAAYGYAASAGFFPECKLDDMEALTRVAVALFSALKQFVPKEAEEAMFSIDGKQVSKSTIKEALKQFFDTL